MPTPMFNIKPHYYASTESGNAYYACNQSATSTTAGLATTWTGLAIGNPAASGFNLVMRKFLVGQAAAGTAGAVGIMGGAGSITASITPLNLNLGLASPASVAHATAGQTISTPVLIKPVASLGSVATTAYGLSGGIVDNLDGDLIVPPGQFIATYTTAATTTALIFAFFWEEIPIAAVGS